MRFGFSLCSSSFLLYSLCSPFKTNQWMISRLPAELSNDEWGKVKWDEFSNLSATLQSILAQKCVVIIRIFGVIQPFNSLSFGTGHYIHPIGQKTAPIQYTCARAFVNVYELMCTDDVDNLSELKTYLILTWSVCSTLKCLRFAK